MKTSHTIFGGLIFICLLVPALGDGTWEIPYRDREIRMDGVLDEWEGVPYLEISPEATSLHSSGAFSPDDVRLKARAFWDETRLYLALEWMDDVWDIENIRRQDAVWIGSDGRRRDRMLFSDNLKLHIRETDYDYILWVSPRVEDRGPYFWNRLLLGYQGMERASAAPFISARDHGDRVTIEIQFSWDSLRRRAREGTEFPVTFILADSDSPGALLESKLLNLKWLAWRGQAVLTRP
ncbi:MAG TPA: hypothetical protein VMN76_06505 [Acidobacteriota bacterium]|nr:hypothetical protein [Acidobacteriota bacterium]